jgi:hypothetical protein
MSILSLQKQSQNTDFPNVRPSLDLRFALAKKLDPRITFTRGSTGTYFGPDGLMRTADVNEPRFDHDPVTGQSLGLLIEESRINYELYSGDPTQWTSNTNMTLTGNSIILPDGTTSTNVEYRGTDSGANIKLLRPAPSGSAVVAGETWTFSMFLRAGTEQTVHLTIQNQTGGDNVGSAFNLVTGQFPGSITGTNAANGSRGFQYFGNGWYRVWLTNTYQSSSGGQQTFVRLRSNTASMQMTTSFSAWGAQLEKGEFPTSYIPTTTSTVTRSTDVASMTGINFSSWYNQSEGTIFISGIVPQGLSSFPSDFSLSDGTNSNRIGSYIFTGGFYVTIRISNSQLGADIRPTFTPIISSPYKKIASYSINEYATTVNANTIAKKFNAPIPNINSLNIGSNPVSTTRYNSTIARLTYYPIQLTNQQLINLTS